MRRKIKLKSKQRLRGIKLKKTDIIILLIILILICLFFVFKFIGNRITPVMMIIAETEAKKLATLIIGNSVSNELSETLDFENLFIISKDNEGNIQTMDYNSVIVNQTLNAAVERIHRNLRYIETGEIEKLDFASNSLSRYNQEDLKKGIFYEIPLGSLFKNAFLVNLGPKIPVKFSLLGDTLANLTTKVTGYGINNALIEITMHLTVRIRVIIPLSTKEIEMEQFVPFSFKIIQGTVPNYFFSGYNQNSPALVFPVE